MSRFTDALIVSPLADGHTWVVLRPFGYDVGKEGSGDRIEVTVGFTTDFASIPRFLWIALPRWGRYGNAAVIHDWLYWTQTRPREAADAVMLEAMGVLEVPAWQRYSIYYAVRALGWTAWHRNRWDREAGRDRVISYAALKATQKHPRPGLIEGALRHYLG